MLPVPEPSSLTFDMQVSAVMAHEKSWFHAARAQIEPERALKNDCRLIQLTRRYCHRGHFNSNSEIGERCVIIQTVQVFASGNDAATQSYLSILLVGGPLGRRMMSHSYDGTRWNIHGYFPWDEIFP